MLESLWSHGPSWAHFWHLVTRLGEAQILLPAALLAVWGLWRRPETRASVACWLLGLGLAVLITTASKVAFIGWGWGWPALNFTGFSGHAMFSAAVYPVLGLSLGLAFAPPVPSPARRWPLALGLGLALLVGVSRVFVGAHSVSEVLAGLSLGVAASVAALGLLHAPQRPLRPLVPALMVLWLAVTPVHAPASGTHELVTRLSLKLSGHPRPYTRYEMLRAYHQQQRSATAPTDS